ncbi:MAG: signal peptidase I [Actinomycetota bacterium]
MKRIAKLLGITTRAAVRTLIVASVVLLLAIGIGPRSGRYRTLTVLSDSMRPIMPVGSVIVVTPVPVTSLRVGDVITYEAPLDDHRVVTHRVIDLRRQDGGIVVRTKGDASSEVDPWRARIDTPEVWRMRAVVPRLGWGIHALRAPSVRRAALFVLPVIAALLWLVQIWGASPPRREPRVI